MNVNMPPDIPFPDIPPDYAGTDLPPFPPLQEQDGRDWIDNPPQTKPPPVDYTQFITSAADIETRIMKWLKYPFAPWGEILSITGMMDTGKTFLLLRIMIDIANGIEWECEKNRPDYQNNPFPIQGTVLGFFAEDTLDTAIKPRLDIMATKDQQRSIHLVNISDRNIDWKIGGTAMEAAIKGVKPVAVFIDTATRFAPHLNKAGKAFNENSKHDVSEVLAILEDYARRLETTIIMTNHPNKQVAQNASHRTSGSQEWLNGVRSGWLLERHPEMENTNVLACIKSNHVWRREHRKSVLLHFSPETGVTVGGTCDLKADDFKPRRLSDKKGDTLTEKPKTLIERAKDFIYSAVEKQGGYMLRSELFSLAKSEGYTESTINDARARSNGLVMVTKRGGGKPTYWYTEGNLPQEQLSIHDETIADDA